MNHIKEFVKNQYSQWVAEENSCCSTDCCVETMAEDYENVEGYYKDADYGLGCGLPLAFAELGEGDKVLDLGSGAGNDCFVARSIVGRNGIVYGLDFSEVMIQKAIKNAKTLNYDNVLFKLGDIEQIPFEDESMDVVISNCVLNLIPNKQKVFAEIHRVLRKGGHFSISDVVVSSEMPEQLKSNKDLYASCISGACSRAKYMNYIAAANFNNIVIKKERKIALPDSVKDDAILPKDFKVYSITVYGER